MGLIDKIFNKVAVPDKLIFDDFSKNYELNLNKVKVIADKLKKDNKKIKNMKFAPSYFDEFLNSWDGQKQDIIELTGSKIFSERLSYIIYCQKWYALYFMNTNKGKTQKERKSIIERLDDLFELSIFITMQHFAIDRKEKIIWKDNSFYYKKDKTSMEVVKLVVENMEIILGLKAAVQEKNNTKVFEMYSKLRDFNTQMVAENPFPEF